MQTSNITSKTVSIEPISAYVEMNAKKEVAGSSSTKLPPAIAFAGGPLLGAVKKNDTNIEDKAQSPLKSCLKPSRWIAAEKLSPYTNINSNSLYPSIASSKKAGLKSAVASFLTNLTSSAVNGGKALGNKLSVAVGIVGAIALPTIAAPLCILAGLAYSVAIVTVAVPVSLVAMAGSKIAETAGIQVGKVPAEYSVTSLLSDAAHAAKCEIADVQSMFADLVHARVKDAAGASAKKA